jgi:plasmid rolling circle replication initiator protein Rep
MTILAAGGDDQTDRWAERICDCARLIALGWNADEGRVKLTGASFCKVRWCPVCAWRKSLCWKARFLQALPSIEAAHPRLSWLHLTLTVRNCDVSNLRATVQAMNHAWHRMTRRVAWPGVGYVRALEVTHSDSDVGDSHPHFHALVAVPATYFDPRTTRGGYVTHEQWVRLWRECLRVDYDPSVRVQRVRPDRRRAAGEIVLHGAVAEIMKYALKASDLTGAPDWFIRVALQLHGTKAVTPGGIVREHLREDEPESDEEMIGEDGEGVTDPRIWVYGWREYLRRYGHDRTVTVRAPTGAGDAP